LAAPDVVDVETAAVSRNGLASDGAGRVDQEDRELRPAIGPAQRPPVVPLGRVTGVLAPDTKDWTWVLERPCPECGFDASTCPPDVVSHLVRVNAARWTELTADGTVCSGRPEPSTWSSLEYACHVRDVYARYDQRIELMLTEDDPLFPNWDQDATAVEEAYDSQVPATVAEELASNAQGLAARLDALDHDQWGRPGRRSDGASFTVASLVRYMIHDPVHHLWDVATPRG
jgi:hypothetical protein